MSEVVVVRWPEERDDAANLVRAGAAILYMVTDEGDPPTPTSCLEDWVRIPGDERDLLARIAALERRAAVHRSPPSVDDVGFLRHQGKMVRLSPREARLAAVLAARFDDIVPDRELILCAAAGASDPSSPLRVEIAHLRAQLRPLDLAIRRVRGRGYKLLAR